MIRSLRRPALSTNSPVRLTQDRPTQGWLASAPTAFAAIFGALWLLHLPLLRLPYFWDEAGYFIPAARDLLLTGDLIPHTTLSNAHPPLVMLWLALCWKLTAFSPLVTRTAMLIVASFGFTALWLLARRVAGAGVAAATVLLTALSPTVFVQSAMAHLDIAAFALLLWTLYAHICGKHWQAVAFAALAAVAKETTVAVTLTLFAADLLGRFAHRRLSPICQKRADWGPQRWPAWAARWCLPAKTAARSAGWLLAPLPLAGWYAYHFHRTGHVLGNPDYLRYNVGATVTPWRILIAVWMRLWHAVGYMNLFVLTASALLLWWSARREGTQDRSHIRQVRADAGHPLSHEDGIDDAPYLPSFGRCGIPPSVQLLFALLVLAQVAEFSVVGGALLARYMIPAIPLVILMSVDVLRRFSPRWAPRWQWWIAASAAAFVAALLFNPPWYIAPEDNLTWAHFVAMHQRAARYAEQHYAGDRILTAWPASDELTRPFLGYVGQGYVQQPLTVVRVENFTPEEMLRARQQEESFDVVLAFSTKFEPRRGFLPRFAGWRRAQTRYFDYHQDLPPATIARLLQGRIVWQESSPGEWVALIEIDKARNAKAGFKVEPLSRRLSREAKS